MTKTHSKLKEKGIEIVGDRVFSLNVCSPLPEKETLDLVRIYNSAESFNDWQARDLDNRNVPCNDCSGYWHYVFIV